jgi:hypothetical protein
MTAVNFTLSDGIGGISTAGGSRLSSLPVTSAPPQDHTIPTIRTATTTATGNTTGAEHRPSSDFANINAGPTTVIEAATTIAVIRTGGSIELTAQTVIQVPSTVVASKTVVEVVGATTTTIVVTAAPQTSFDANGSPSVFIPTTQTIVALAGGSITTTVVADDGLTAQTSVITTLVGGTPVTVVSTPPPQTVVTTGVDGQVITVVTTPPPQTVVATVGGSLTTLLAITTPGQPVTETLVSVIGGTVITVTPSPVTYVTDLGGGVIATRTSTPSAFVTTIGGTTTAITLVTTPGLLVTTSVATTISGTLTTVPTVLTITPSASTRMTLASSTINPQSTSSAGNTNSSGSNANGQNGTEVVVPNISAAQYFAGTFVPTMVAVALAIPMAILDLDAKLFQPFRSLSLPQGADGPEAMTLRFTGLHSVVSPMNLLVQGQPVTFITTLLLWLSRLMAPLAAEAIGMKIHGTCSHLVFSGCGMDLGVSTTPASALIALMAVMLMLLIILAVLLRSWDTGLHYNPWTTAGIASLSLSRRLRDPLLRVGEPNEADLDAIFRYSRFRLEAFETPEAEDDGNNTSYRSKVNPQPSRNPDADPVWEYGIIPIWGDGTSSARRLLTQEPTSTASSRGRNVPFLALTYASRVVFMAVLLSLAALLLYYQYNEEDNAFELFMDSQAFGVKFLFAAIGGAISFFWTSFFMSKFSLLVYHHAIMLTREIQILLWCLHSYSKRSEGS